MGVTVISPAAPTDGRRVAAYCFIDGIRADDRQLMHRDALQTCQPSSSYSVVKSVYVGITAEFGFLLFRKKCSLWRLGVRAPILGAQHPPTTSWISERTHLSISTRQLGYLAENRSFRMARTSQRYVLTARNGHYCQIGCPGSQVQFRLITSMNSSCPSNM